MEDSLFDEREELMVSPSGGIPHLRKARFLNPIAFAIEGPTLKLPSIPFPSESGCPLDATFHGCNGWRDQPKKWRMWVETMESVHHHVWKAAGIYEAVISSVHRVHTDKNLIFGLVERWCCETNTFVFPWGEATVTLEDMMLLGGLSVLGDLVLSPLQSPELVVIQENIEKSRKTLIGSKDNNHTRWLNLFMNSGKDYEHEAFLSLWLSKFVFPGKVLAPVFPVAVNLARGVRLALAPAVLASIYRDLGLLKQAMLVASSTNNGDRVDIPKLWSPLFFLQVWAWERLVSLRPQLAQNYNMISGVRIGRWINVKQSGVINVRTTIDLSGELFQWRPYALAVEGWLTPKFYKEKEELTTVDGENLDLEMESFIRCLRASELVGFDCQEPYRPNRVAMQFGYDQDFPKWIPRSSSSPELAWINYSRPSDSGLRLYYPARLFEPDVTTQYLKWWKKEILFLADGGETYRDVSDLPTEYPAVPPGFSPMLKQVKVETVPDVPPGFSPRLKQKHIADGCSSEPNCNREKDKENIPMEVSETVACDVVPPGSMEEHADGEDDSDESYRIIARNLIQESEDLMKVIDRQLSEFKR